MKLNELAIECIENNQYDQAIKYFQEAVRVSRDVQSLHNLAWIYFTEEENVEKALELSKEAIRLQPLSYLPYNLLGEIYAVQDQWELVSEILQKSIMIHPSKAAYHNLAIAKFHLGKIEEAAVLFHTIAGDSDYAYYCYIKCLILLNKEEEAKTQLITFNTDTDDFVGELAVADLYLELMDYPNAIHWFEKVWEVYRKELEWISRFVYALYMKDQKERVNKVIKESIQLKEEEIREAHQDEIDENWTLKNQEEYLQKLKDEKQAYEDLEGKVKAGFVPQIPFETHIEGGCYLFGCKRHGHPEYQDN